MFTFLLILQFIVALALITVILMQKSEGGGLGVGGSPAGFLSARGAADFLTRATAMLATAFVGLCIALAVFASVNHNSAQVNTEAKAASVPAAAAPALPALPAENGVPIAGGGTAPAADPLAAAAAAAGNAPATGPEAPAKGVPLQQ